MLLPTVASTTRTPSRRSSGTSVATTFSMPPYPGGGTGSHGPAFISTVSFRGKGRNSFGWLLPTQPEAYPP